VIWQSTDPMFRIQSFEALLNRAILALAQRRILHPAGWIGKQRNQRPLDIIVLSFTSFTTKTCALRRRSIM
jgi:hypothetical protein